MPHAPEEFATKHLIHRQRRSRPRGWLPGAAALALVASLGFAAPAAAAQEQPTGQRPVFENGRAQPVYAGEEIITQNVWVEVEGMDTDRDGVNDRIRVQIRRPASTDKGIQLPIIMQASPYWGEGGEFLNNDVHVPLYAPERPGYAPPPEPGPFPYFPLPDKPYDGTEPPHQTINGGTYQNEFLSRGFIFAHAQMLGTGSSTGCTTGGGPEEHESLKAVIDWFNGRADAYDIEGNAVEANWTTGLVGMIGTSYDGTLPIGVATTGVKELRAIVPIAAISSYYDYRRMNGTPISTNTNLGGDQNSNHNSNISRKYPEVCDYTKEEVRRGQDRLTGEYNDWWRERNYLPNIGNIAGGVLVQHGLNDQNVKLRNAAQLVDALEKNGIPHQVWLHQGGHGDRALSNNRAAWLDLLNRWWSYWLHGVDNDVLDEPAAVVEREDGTWTSYDSWPAPGSAATPLFLGASGDNTTGKLTLTRNAADGPVTETFIDDMTIDATSFARAEQSKNRLAYRTARLTEPVHLSGTVHVSTRMSINARAGLVSAMLVEYPKSGDPKIIARGWSDPLKRFGLDRSFGIEPGAPFIHDFDLQPHDYVFSEGSQIGLVVYSSDRVFTLRPPPGTELSLYTHHNQTRVDLPVVGGASALASALGDA
ncbi:CocE/NonD family hydrolase [Micromonospora avicenniae]|nr:CocE/NonD family hydrolase [Micromonospora avicenniae]